MIRARVSRDHDLRFGDRCAADRPETEMGWGTEMARTYRRDGGRREASVSERRFDGRQPNLLSVAAEN